MRDPIGWWTGLERPFRHLPRGVAITVLALLVAAMAWSGFSMVPGDEPTEILEIADEDLEEGDGDLALYERISDRVIAGENYYAAAMDEQRAGNYPTKPFVTVRLPTLAMLHSWIGRDAFGIVLLLGLPAAILLLMAQLTGKVAPSERVGAGIAMLLGGAGLIIPDAPLIHEVVAGLLLSLALAIYRPDRWWPALIFAAMALAIREIAAPFVLLWLAFAVAEKRWKEALAVAALLITFAVGMYLHYLGVEAQRLPGDVASQGWDALAGPILPLTALSLLTILLVLPPWLAAPIAILPLMGWIGMGHRLGLFAALWFGGFFTAMALFARPENFYWVQLTLPVYLAGLALAPRAIADLLASGRGKSERHS
ncbi:hypothetical protein [Aurantiacibacter sp. D1-12]|uniref:hypothetical protein n=1 Tax=Aurantiacibacter sp. D1-12 TaxID=2993658 RepID=UPI00237C6EA0|nr:hypothetical protein [Aurantiacibacter sp. D1-12]MDE1467226.1 hypothetical protein [Aurantiacibacter sp. D1-12]